MLTANSLIIFDYDGDVLLFDDLLTFASKLEADDLDEGGVKNRVAFDGNGCKYIISLSTDPGFDYVRMYDFNYPGKVFQLPAASRNVEGLNLLLKDSHERTRESYPKEAFPDLSNASTEEILKFYISEDLVTTLNKCCRQLKGRTYSEWIAKLFVRK